MLLSPGRASGRRFDSFEMDLEAGELRNNGYAVPLQDKAFQLLALLLESAGQVVNRNEIRQRLWGPDTFVEFDDSLNHVVKKLREALGDSAESPRFIQTVPRRGYRFIAPLLDGPSDESSRTSSRPVSAKWNRPLLLGALAGGVALLAWLGSGGRQEPIPVQIAVLPFVHLEPGVENELFADGITSDIINALARIPRLRVVARSSAFQYKGRAVDVREIGRSLGVEAVIEGTVRRNSNHLSINARIVNAADGFQRWSRGYEPSPGEEMFVYENVVRDVAGALKVPPPGDASESFWRHSKNRDAYELVLKARYLVPTTLETADTKIRYYRAAIERDPEYAAAWLGLANTWGRLAGMAAVPPVEVMDKAREAVSRALKIDDTLPDAHFLAAGIHWNYDWDWTAADREFRRAIQLDPSSANIRSFYALYLSHMGRFDDALRLIASIRALEPLSADSRTTEAGVLYLSRQYDRSLDLCKTLSSTHPAASGLYYWMGRSYASKGMPTESLVALEQFLPANEDRGRGFGMLGAIYAQSGRIADALRLLRRALERASRAYVSPVSIAQIYIGLGDYDSALDWLEKGYVGRDSAMSTLKIELAFDPIRSSTRFQALVRKLNLP